MADRPTFGHHSKPASSPKSWFNLSPPTTQMPSPKPDARLTARINKVKETLAFVKPTIDVRRHLVALGETKGKYCTLCSKYRDPSYCSPECPRLGSGPWVQGKVVERWMRSTKRDIQLYEQLAEDVENHGSKATKQMAQVWETNATDLLKRTEEDDGPDRHKRMVQSHRGFDKHWTFDEHWGKGPGLETGVRPEDLE